VDDVVGRRQVEADAAGPEADDEDLRAHACTPHCTPVTRKLMAGVAEVKAPVTETQAGEVSAYIPTHHNICHRRAHPP
jgi:hypothetical protein